jgi:methyl-accepting chemotaxis protein
MENLTAEEIDAVTDITTAVIAAEYIFKTAENAFRTAKTASENAEYTIKKATDTKNEFDEVKKSLKKLVEDSNKDYFLAVINIDKNIKKYESIIKDINDHRPNMWWQFFIGAIGGLFGSMIFMLISAIVIRQLQQY